MEYMLKVYKLTIFFSVCVCSLCMRFKRKEGDQAPSGQCSTYSWGGISGLHWYVCCNNCDQPDGSCDGTTYQSASTEPYCSTCGIDTKRGDGTIHGTYSCGGCQGQNRIRNQCLANIRSVYQIRGLCWAFACCFQTKCKALKTPDTCFNLMCDPGETVDNCPTDCCGTKNEKCAWNKPDTCAPQCCNEHTCCDDTSGSSARESFGIVCVGLVSIMFFYRA